MHNEEGLDLRLHMQQVHLDCKSWIMQPTIPVSYESVSSDNQEIQAVKCVLCICSCLHQTEQQAQLQDVVQAWRSHVQAKTLSHNSRESPG